MGFLEHQDGGVLANNPTAVALHEAKLLWPKEKLQCVVSVGNGRTIEEPELIQYKPSGILGWETSLQLSRIIDSATDTVSFSKGQFYSWNFYMFSKIMPGGFYVLL